MIAIPIDKPNSCWDCFNADCDHWGEHGYDNSADCTLIDIVTCKECKHRSYCCRGRIPLNDDGFCSEGERK